MGSQPTLNLYDKIQRGDALILPLGDGYSGLLRNWWRSIRGVGGFWIGEGDLATDRWMMQEMYLEGLGRRVVESVGSTTTWEGMIYEMSLTLDGQTYRRGLRDCANAVKAIYSKVGDNLFSDGSAESAAWTQVGTPSTHERVTTWYTTGSYGMHVVTDAADEGTEIESGIAIAAGRSYQCQVNVDVEAGTWTLGIYRSDNDAALAQATSSGTGDDLLRCYISDSNSYAGNVYVRLTASGTGAEIYADGAIFQLAPAQARTKVYTDADSIAAWGRLEDVLLLPSMTSDAAAAEAQRDVNERAWPRSVPPDEFEATFGTSEGETEGVDALQISFVGYVFTLGWRYLLSGGTAAASSHISALIGESEFITAGIVDTNSLSYQVEEQNPLRIWDAIEEIILAGDGSGNRWIGGVYAGRQFNYEAAPTTLDYHYRGGRLLSVNNAPIEPWFARPGLARLDDMPVGPAALTGLTADDPRVVYLEEVEYIAPMGLRFKRRAEG
jgi:hypothetical protein